MITKTLTSFFTLTITYISSLCPGTRKPQQRTYDWEERLGYVVRRGDIEYDGRDGNGNQEDEDEDEDLALALERSCGVVRYRD
jgi:hypothetical protein